MTHKKFSEALLSQQSIGIKFFYSSTSDGFKYQKVASVNFLLTCSWKEKLEQ